MSTPMTLSRRHLMTGAIAVAAALAPHASASPQRGTPRADAGGGTLGALAAAKGLLLGASYAVHESDRPHGALYDALYAREMRAITSELELKLGVLRPDPGTLDFGPADRLFAFSEANRLAVRGHTLIWNDGNPPWIKALGQSEAARLLDSHIEAVLARYRGRAFAWDVVNEPIAPWDNEPGNLRAGPFLRAFGEDYIARSFRIARAAEPGAKLALNEAFTETADERGEIYRTSFMALLRRLKDQGTPIDAIGLQCHLSSQKRYDFARFRAFVEEIAAMGYEIHITELDVDDTAFPRPLQTRDARVAALYRDFLAAILPVRAVTVLTFWQLADHTSWLHYDAVAKLPNATRRPRPLPFDEAFSPKAAYHAVAAALKVMPPR